jgi:undecaprenyl-diphosphatase
VHSHLSWLEATTIGLMQGVTELFPVSSLGHSVLIPAVIGGSWARDLDVAKPESPYLAFIVGLHVATALALVLYFWRDWVRIVAGLGSSIAHRRISTESERLAWMLIIATIPVGLAGLLLEHALRTHLAKPSPAAVFLIVNGLVLFASERWKRRAPAGVPSPTAEPLTTAGAARFQSMLKRSGNPMLPAGHPDPHAAGTTSAPEGYVEDAHLAEPTAAEQDAEITSLSFARATVIGASQIAALAPGISRSGIAMATGLTRGLSHESAARFSFLLATPVILAAGVLKIPDLMGPLGDGIRPQVLVGSILSGIGAYLSVRFLSRYFENRSLRPFGWYCVVAGAVALVLVNR